MSWHVHSQNNSKLRHSRRVLTGVMNPYLLDNRAFKMYNTVRIKPVDVVNLYITTARLGKRVYDTVR